MEARNQADGGSNPTQSADLRSSTQVANGVALAATLLLSALALLALERALLPVRALPALGLAIGFAVTARLLHAVSFSGAVAGWAVAFVLYLSAGVEAFLCLLTVFLLTWLATGVGHARKQQLGTAEARCGRSASQVAANVGMAALLMLPAQHAGVSARSLLIIAAIAVLAEAAADTVSSEIGQALSARAYLLTSFEAVPVGTDGGISFAGTSAGILAALLVAAVAAGLRLIPWPAITVVAGSAVLGMFADSLLGAVFERRGRLTNNFVNLISTSIAAAVAGLLRLLLAST